MNLANSARHMTGFDIRLARRPVRAVRVSTAMLLLTGIAACVNPASSGVIVPAPAPLEPLSPMEADFAGLLLRLEDRREMDMTILAVGSRADAVPLRRLAALALGRIDGPDSRPVLRGLLADGDTSVAASSAFMLGELRDTAATPALAALLISPSIAERPTVAREAAGALGRIATGEARRAIADFLSDGTAEAAAASADPLLRAIVGEALIAAWRAGETDVRPFVRWTRDHDPEIRWRAAYGLGRLRSTAAVPELLFLLEDGSASVRAAAIRGLTGSLVTAAGHSATPVRDRLAALAAGDDDYSVRVQAIRALAGFMDVETVRFLVDRLALLTPHEAAVAIEVLGQAGDAFADRVVPPLRAIADDVTAPAHLRALAVESTARFDLANSGEWLDALSADDDWRVRAAVARAAARRGPVSFATLTGLARAADPRVANAAVDALLEVSGAEGIAEHRGLLIELLQAADVHLRATVLRGLGSLGDPTTYPAVLDAYDRARFDRENAAAVAAIDAIADLRRNGSLSPERAFFARFPRSGDPIVRLRAATRFPEAALAAWGDPLPIETYWVDARYREHVIRWIAPQPGPANLPRVRVETELGDVEAVLFGDLAPATVSNFLDLAAAGYFDGREWPRVVPDFVVQGGDPRGDTYGGPGYTIRDEINRARFDFGTIGMALDGPDTGGSQFFITLSPQPHLDGGYTAFGEVVSGIDVIERLLPGDRILSVREITEDS